MSPSVEDYIRTERKRGVSDAQLRQALSNYYTPQIIDHAFATLGGAAQKKLYIYVGGIVGVIILVMTLFYFAVDDSGIGPGDGPQDSIVDAPLEGISSTFDDAIEESSLSVPTCGEYCRKVMQGCVGENAQYLSNEDCMQFCGSTAAILAGNYGSTQDNTLGCRIKSAELAESLNAD